MIQIKARIQLLPEGRKTPIASGYHPDFDCIPTMKTGGRIHLLDQEQLAPGEAAEVHIQFVNNQYLGPDFGAGKTFSFGEGNTVIGTGVVLEITTNDATH